MTSSYQCRPASLEVINGANICDNAEVDEASLRSVRLCVSLADTRVGRLAGDLCVLADTRRLAEMTLVIRRQ